MPSTTTQGILETNLARKLLLWRKGHCSTEKSQFSQVLSEKGAEIANKIIKDAGNKKKTNATNQRHVQDYCKI